MSKVYSVSIITINYNNCEGLKQTLKSVFSQTYKGYELIVIDGNSTDGSVDLLKQHNAKIHTWISEPDKGIYNAMNKGISRANGDYLLFLSAGDWFYNSEVLKTATPHLNKFDFIYGNIIYHYSLSKQVLEKVFEGKTLSLKNFFNGESLNHPVTFHKRTVFESYGLFDESYKIVSDWQFFIKAIVLNQATVKYINTTIACFDMTGISNSNYKLKITERQNVIKTFFPVTIWNDYVYFSRQSMLLKTNRFKMLNALESSRPAQKILSIVLRVLLFVFKGKRITDL